MPTSQDFTIHCNSENSVLIVWPEKICAKQHRAISCYQQEIKKKLSQLVIETVSSYNSLMVYYRFDLMSSQEFSDKLQRLWLHRLDKEIVTNTQTETQNIIEIPVYYGVEAGWDLPELSEKLAIPINEIISLHSNQVYRAYALGFTPGFCYLASLPKPLQISRRSNPRIFIPQGSVAIAEKQTAVYPSKSPGGWHVIGQTPMTMFTANKEDFIPAISVGQQVTFKAVSREEYRLLGGKVEVQN